ncbi:MAG: hypothetical protein NWE89_00905 [Candidatus Bathyarchaeota archaeon]|nr:hypothetical protein [Candidatus Bathyarchaeota archaeon]
MITNKQDVFAMMFASIQPTGPKDVSIAVNKDNSPPSQNNKKNHESP